ncbi:MAG: hypothetical protein CBD27_06110 [Rhodospirillaceae bacterium TMED167]|nr:hypothetical protein [Rhodospirillaceae bacterium]OUW27490.1 MAG: hypothetical protein CBD27_06110 [Rhodospirillaceae bacterium TMED167]|tara:strand:+ start:314 stop:895 length:582 start_codon:yes stop_codon:yes gene_type:complete
MQSQRWTFGLALLFLTVSAVTLFAWIPNDVESGVIVTFRRRTAIGDAMAPTLTAYAILIVSCILALTSFRKGMTSGGPPEGGPDSYCYRFILRLAVPLVLGVVLMKYTGPIAVDLVNVVGGDLGTYRLLKAAFPYKYLGFLVGGFVMVFGFIRVVENRFSPSAALLSVLAVLVLILLYDVPFDNILLPPNGDF